MPKTTLSSTLVFSAILVSVLAVHAQRGSSGGPETRQERAVRTDTYNRSVDSLSGRVAVPASLGMSRRNYLPLDSDFRKTVLATQATKIGTIVHIVDGDTVYLQVNDRVMLLRLSGVDAPDLGQPKYEDALEFLKQSLLDKKVTIHYSTYGIWDQTGVPLVTISDGDADVGLKLIENGMAWYNEAHQFYLSKATTDLYKGKCNEAKDKKAGLWVERSPEKPWEYRARIRKEEERKKTEVKKP